MRLTPKNVTIAVPVFNEQPFIAATLRSAAPQAANIIVVDNASSDATGEIVIDLAKEYGNISYVRHPANRGAINNYLYALEAANTEYFMWLGGHDQLTDGYVKLLSGALDRDPEVVLAFPPSGNLDSEGRPIGSYRCEFAELLTSPHAHERVYAIIRGLTDCSMVHGLFRRSALLRSWFHVPCIGFDHVLLCRAAALGKFQLVDGTRYLRRNPHSHDSKAKQLSRITPDNDGLQADCYDPMLRAQLEVMQSLAPGFFWTEKARLQLIRRFGFFPGDTPLGNYRNKVISSSLYGLRGLRSLIAQDRR